MELDFYPNEIIEGRFVTLRIEAVGGDLDRVVCRYPRSFLNEMAKQLTAEIEAALGVEGLAESSVELVMAFAPNTYLEHTSENVTYRRLMLMDKVSSPRDFWIKWTRLTGEITEYASHNIRFELGEDVDQKIREKEYRYLLASGKDGYHNSMGRKKVTEWREVIKRAAKRGELTKLEDDLELVPEIFEIEARIANLLGKKVPAVAEPEFEYAHSDESAFESALAKMREVVESVETEENPTEEGFVEEALEIEETVELEEVAEAEDAEEISVSLFDAIEVGADSEGADEEMTEEIFEEISEESVEEAEEEFKELSFEEAEEESLLEEVEETEELVLEEVEEPEELLFEETVEESEEIIPEEDVEESLPEEIIEEAAEETVEETAEETAEEEIPAVEEIYSTPLADRAAHIRAEIEAKIRLEYETKARIKAEEELIALRCEYHSYRLESESLLSEAQRELERLRLEYNSFVEEIKNREARRKVEEAQRIAEENELRLQIELQLRREAQERERLEEAARQAIDEQHRLEETVRLAVEEQRRLEAENARIALEKEENENLELVDRRRLEEEMAREDLRQAEILRARREEEEARAKAEVPNITYGKYVYTSKSVKLIFRRSVDPNITNRIHEIIKATVEYYGKDNVTLKIKAMVTDSQTVVLEFAEIPIEEMALLGNIVKILGNSGLGIAKAIIE